MARRYEAQKIHKRQIAQYRRDSYFIERASWDRSCVNYVTPNICSCAQLRLQIESRPEPCPREKLILKTEPFESRRENECMFTDTVAKPVRLIRGGNVAVVYLYDLRRHYETKHLDAEQKLQ